MRLALSASGAKGEGWRGAARGGFRRGNGLLRQPGREIHQCGAIVVYVWHMDDRLIIPLDRGPLQPVRLTVLLGLTALMFLALAERLGWIIG